MTRLPVTFATPVDASSFDAAQASATRAETAGYDSLSFGDRPAAAGLAGWVLSVAVAARTERIRLFHSTLNLPYRFPQVLAKEAASLDVISGGRLDLCLGAGGPSMAADYEAYGIPLRPLGRRLDDLVEAIGLMRALWSGVVVDHDGPHYALHQATCVPGPVAGTIPVWMGAGAPRGLGIAGRLADGWIKNRGWGPPEQLAAMNRTVTASALAAGRDPDAVRCIMGAPVRVTDTAGEADAFRAAHPDAEGLIGTAAQILEAIAAHRDAGVDTFHVRAVGPGPDEQLLRFAEDVIGPARAWLAPTPRS